MHLLYARFWHKVLFDAGLVSTPEPFQKLFNQGMVEAFAYEDEGGRLVASDEIEARGDGWVQRATGAPVKQIVTKMAKSLKNVVNPDDIIAEYGADTFRLYEMFMGPLADSKPWNPRDIPGCRRFVERVWRLFVDPESDARVRPAFAAGAPERPLEGASQGLERALNQMLAKCDQAFVHLNLNTAIAAMMTFLNEATRASDALTRPQALRFVQALAPFAPHVAEELWSRMGAPGELARSAWPVADPRWLVEDELEIPVQVNGRHRATIKVPKDADTAALEVAARASVAAHVEGKQLVKVVVVAGRLVNFVVR
jgi:leucyl-tRNA synthetase